MSDNVIQHPTTRDLLDRLDKLELALKIQTNELNQLVHLFVRYLKAQNQKPQD